MNNTNSYLEYNSKKGQWHIPLEISTYRNDGDGGFFLLSKDPMPDSIVNEFTLWVSVLFDFENRPENSWEYKRKSSIPFPSLEEMKKMFERFKKSHLSDPKRVGIVDINNQ